VDFYGSPGRRRKSRRALAENSASPYLAPLFGDASQEEPFPMIKFRTALMCSALLLGLAPLPASAVTSLVYITNSAGDKVDVINPATNKVVQQFPIVGAHGVQFSPDGSKVYISNEMTSTLDVFEQKTGKLIKAIKLSNHPNNIGVAKDGRIVVAIARGEGALDIIDPVKLEVKKTIPTHGRLHNCYTSNDGNWAICGSVQTGVFTAFDLKTETIAWEHKFDHGVRPMTIEHNPDGSPKKIYVQLAAYDGFAVLDFKTHQETARIQLPNLHTGVDMDPGREDAPSHGIGVSPDGKSVWVTSIPQNAVFAYNTSDLKLTDTIKLPDLQLPGRRLGGAVANWVTFSHDGQMYISNSGLKSVTAIDLKSKKISAVVPVGEVPKRINTLFLN
jgi:YVTN family beta-propeller protein